MERREDPVNDREVLTPSRKKVRGEVEEMIKGIRKSTAHKLHADDEGVYQRRYCRKENSRPRSNVLQEYGRRRLARTRVNLSRFHGCWLGKMTHQAW